VALAALVEARLAAAGIANAMAVGGWDGWRLGTTTAGPEEVSKIAAALVKAMTDPVVEGEPALAAVSRKLGALANRPLPDAALAELAECTGEAYGSGAQPANAAEIEAWRRAAHRAGRVAFATAGKAPLSDAVAAALASAGAWPGPAEPVELPWPSEAPTTVYDASGEIAAGAARIIVTARTALPERAVSAAESLGSARGALASRLAGLDASAQLRSVVATAHADGGCVAATLELSARELASDASARIATAAALARQEVAVEVGDAPAPRELGKHLATQALDPREAAQLSAWWALAGARTGPPDALALRVTVGVAAPASTTPATTAPSAPFAAIQSEIDRATLAWHAPVVEARSRVERGQGEMWLLLASPCGTQSEAEGDAGAGAVVAAAAAADATERDPDARVEAFVAADGVGLLAHGAAREGETPEAQARRLADIAARSLAAQSLRKAPVRRAQAQLLAVASRANVRGLTTLAGALSPGHPSWVLPEGTEYGLGSVSEESISLRASALRAGPLRVAVLANADGAQADAAVRAVDRWIARRPGELRTCPQAPLLPSPRPETHAVALAPGASSQALLAFPLPTGEAAQGTAAWLVGALDGPDGLVARALGAGGSTPLARSSNAELVGEPRSAAMVIRVEAAEGSLDAAVAQIRALLDRVRQGALREEDRARAGEALSRAALAASLDPRSRVVALWRGAAATPPAPTLDALRAFAASSLREDGLVIVAARPPRLDADGHPFTAREAKPPPREAGARH
jgi:hypothetical protein